MRNTLKYRFAVLTAAIVAGIVFINCNQTLNPPDPVSSSMTYVRIASSGDNARTIMPAMIKDTDVSRYEVSITKEGSAAIVWTTGSPEDKAELQQGGHGFELENGIWEIKIDAYRVINETEYLSGRGITNFEVLNAGPYNVSITIEEIHKADWDDLEGFFSWDLTLPAGVTIETATLGGVALPGDITGSINKKAGNYGYSLILKDTTTGLTAGIYERVYIYPGLKTPAVFNFASGDYKLEFGENIPVSGKLSTVTGSGVSPVGADFTITAYSDAACTSVISIAPAQVDALWNWTIWIPANKIGQTVYIKAGSSKWSLSGGVPSAVPLTSEVKTGVLVPAPSIVALDGTVSISGEAFVGNTLTAVTSGLIGQHGALVYQWKVADVNTGTDPNYKILEGDIGKTITVTVTSTGNVGSVTSAATVEVNRGGIVTFDGNDHTGGSVPVAQAAPLDSSIFLPAQGTMVRTDYTFGGWNTRANGNGENYAAGTSYTVNADTTLYAKWTVSVPPITNPYPTVEGSGGTTSAPAGWHSEDWYAHEGYWPTQNAKFNFTWTNEGRPGGSNRSFKVVATGTTLTPPTREQLTNGIGSSKMDWETVAFSYNGRFQYGDGKWVTDAMQLTPGMDYVYSDWYKSDVETEVIMAVYTQTAKPTADTEAYIYLNLPVAPRSTEWTEYRETFTVPSNAKWVNVFHCIQRIGYLQTTDYKINTYKHEGFNEGMVTITFDDDWESGADETLTYMHGFKAVEYYASNFIESLTTSEQNTAKAKIQKFMNANHEIGAHSVHHPYLTAYPDAEVRYQVDHSKQFFQNFLGIPMKHFATPFGDYNTFVNQVIMDESNFTTHRTVDIGYNSKDNLDLRRLKCMGIEYCYNGTEAWQIESRRYRTTMDQFKEWVDKAKAEKLWLILLYHDVRVENNKIGDLQEPGGSGATREMFIDNMDYLYSQGIKVVTISEALQELRNQGVLP